MTVLTVQGLWGRIYPQLDAGVAVDLHQVFGIDLDADPSPWDARTWHWIRDRILRCASIEGTFVGKVATD